MKQNKIHSSLKLALALGLIQAITSIGVEASALGIRPPSDIPRTPAPTPKPATPTPKPPVATPVPTPAATPVPPISSTFKALWIGQNADAPNWTLYVRDAVDRYGDALVKGPADIADFCPMYDRLGHQDRLNFWVQLIAAMTRYESSFKPTMRYTESTMGIDPVTGKQVVSEGLLQLSYQDERNYKSVLPAGVCDFDYQADSQLAVTDIRRTIFDPKTNLTCGVGILNRQVVRTGRLAVGSGAYWAVLKTTAAHNKLAEIKAITTALSFCR